MTRYLTKLALLTTILVLGLHVLGLWLHKVFQQDEGDKVEWMKGVKGQRFDYAFLGNSRALTGVNVQRLNEKTGLKGINLGYSDASLMFVYASLYSFIEQQQNEVRTAVVQMGPLILFEGRRHKYPLADLYYHDLSKDREFDGDFEYQNLAKVYSYAPIFKYVEYHALYSLKKFFRARSNVNLFKESLGTTYMPDLDSVQIPRRYQGEIAPCTTLARDFDHFKKLVDFCEEREIELVLYTAPAYRYSEFLGKEYPKFDSLLTAHLTENESNWYDFRDLWPKKVAYFPDVVHLNKEGVAAFTDVLSKEMVELKTLSDQ